MDQLKEDTKYL